MADSSGEHVVTRHRVATVTIGVVAGLATLALIAVAAGVFEPQATPKATPEPAAALPPPTTINAPVVLLDAGQAVTFPELVGVSKEDAIAWAEDSGFFAIVDSSDEELRSRVLAPHRRITFTFEDGVVTQAVAG